VISPPARAIVCLALIVAGTGPGNCSEPLPHRLVSIALPGAPSKLLPTDLDGDGLQDLLVVLVYTEYEEISFDRVEGFIMLTEVVPALSERRELRAYLRSADGTYRMAGEPLPLPLDVTAISAGPPGRAGMVAVALTRDGISGIMSGKREGHLELDLRSLLIEPPVLRGSHAFLPGLKLVEDLDGDESLDLLLPARDGLAVFRGTAEGFTTQPSDRIRSLDPGRGPHGRMRRVYPLPRVQDVDGDGLPDLLFRAADPEGDDAIVVLSGSGGGRFEKPRRILLGCLRTARGGEAEPDLIHFGDVDGRGAAEIVILREIESGEGDLDEARRPHSIVSFHHLRPDLTVDPDPYQEIEVIGHAFEGQLAGGEPEPLRDLDGDGRKDLVTVALDFSVLQVVRVLATKKLGIGLDFHIWSQKSDGGFSEVEGLSLSDKILIDLNDLKFDRLGNFAGDFDGDGRRELLTLKGGRTIEIHRGAPGCAYARSPDLELRLAEVPQNPGLVRVMELDGDGRDDLVVTRLLEADPAEATTPVSLDLYLSGSTR